MISVRYSKHLHPKPVVSRTVCIPGLYLNGAAAALTIVETVNKSWTVTCKWMKQDGSFQTVSDHLCSTTKPSMERDCHVECEYQWSVLPWGDCMGLCGEGEQTRQVTCQWIKTASLSETVSDSLCDHTPKPPPHKSALSMTANMCGSRRSGGRVMRSAGRDGRPERSCVCGRTCVSRDNIRPRARLWSVTRCAPQHLNQRSRLCVSSNHVRPHPLVKIYGHIARRCHGHFAQVNHLCLGAVASVPHNSKAGIT